MLTRQQIEAVTFAMEHVDVGEPPTADDYRNLAVAIDRLARNWLLAAKTRRELLAWSQDAVRGAQAPADPSWKYTVIDAAGAARLLSRAASDASAREGALGGLVAGLALGVVAVGSRLVRTRAE